MATRNMIMNTTSAHRQGLHRERKRRRLKCVTLEIRFTEVTELSRRGPLKEDAQGDREAIRNALYAHLDKTLQGAA